MRSLFLRQSSPRATQEGINSNVAVAVAAAQLVQPLLQLTVVRRTRFGGS